MLLGRDLIKQKILLAVVLVMYGLTALGINASHAQLARMPNETLLSSPSEQSNTEQSDSNEQFVDVGPKPATGFASTNSYLSTLLQLQTQIEVIQRFIDRQEVVNDMAENLTKLDVVFIPPKPDKTLCLQIPSNLLCSKSYPEEYAMFLERYRPEPKLELLSINDILSSIPVMNEEGLTAFEQPTEQEEEEKEEEETQESEPTAPQDEYAWTQIECLKGKCMAIIIDANQSFNNDNPSSQSFNRYSVIAGSTLPNGLVVKSISTEGVQVSHPELEIELAQLAPAPSETQ